MEADNLKIHQFSPNMLKTFELCPKKFYLRYIKNIQIPVNDEIFQLGKNIHALASYYLRKENIDRMEKSLTPRENEIWNCLKNSKYFSYEVVGTEYNLAFKEGKYFFGGRLDALVKNGDEYYILDYKTGSAPKNAQYDFQTILYILAVKKFFKTSNIKFIYIDLRQKEDVVITYTEELDEKYSTKLLSAVTKIEQGNFSNSCSQMNACEYKKLCYPF